MKLTPRIASFARLQGLFVFACASLQAAAPQAPTPAAVSGGQNSKHYTRFEAGVSVLNDVSVKLTGFGTVGDLGSKAGPALSLAYGYRTSDQLYWEGEISYAKNDWDDGFSGGATGVSILSNLVFVSNPSNSSRISWGVGGGSTVIRANIGLGRLSLPADSQAGFTGQLKALGEFKIAEANTFTLGYRFRYIDGPTFSSGLGASRILAHAVTAGFGISF